MRQYYFDIRDGANLIPDDEGIELPDIHSAGQEAVKTLADIVKDNTRLGGLGDFGQRVTVEVRDDDGPVLQASLILKL